MRISVILICLLALIKAEAQQVVIDNPDIIQANLVKITKPLRDITSADTIARSFPRKRGLKLGVHPKNDWILHERVNPNALPQGIDPALQKKYGNLQDASSNVILNFDGIDFTGVNPPDPTIDVGPNHVIQMTNAPDGALVVIWDKDGNELVAPFLMDGITGVDGLGDPIVIYDHIADRWMLTEFGDNNVVGNKLICMVSQTSDPTGSYYVYSFDTPFFPDYPKFGLWPDMYLVTSNESDVQAVYAMDRIKMLNGDGSATMQRFADLDKFQTLGFQAATPTNLSGSTLPAANEPGIVMRIADDGWANVNDDRLEIWELMVDFDDASNSSLTGPLNLLTDPFDTHLCGFTSFSCIEQPSGFNDLDPLREVLMNRIFYRNFGTHESIVCTHVTDVDGNDRAGVRWYELRRTGGNWEIYQQGTFSPADGDSRWMSTIAINDDGSIGLAYNISSSTTFPSLGFTGRNFCDPLGEMTIAENVIAQGAASNNSNRYGDYNDMNVDPVDGSFWFTGEYNPNSNWSTHVVHFDIALECDVFQMSSTPITATICPGETETTYTIDVAFLGNYDSDVSLSTMNLPAGVSSSFSPNNLMNAGISTLTITDNSLVPGSYDFIAKGVGGGLDDELLLGLIHYDNLPLVINTTSPVDGATKTPYNGALQWDADGNAEEYLLQVATDNAFNNLIVDQEVTTTSFDYENTLLPGNTYYWRVQGKNICGNGPFSVEKSFTVEVVIEECFTVNSADVPVNIFDNTSVTSELTMPSLGPIFDINITNLEITHTYSGDLDISLISPALTEVVLINQICGNSEDLFLQLDDDGIADIPCPATTGQAYQPEQALSTFSGEDPMGTWTLTVTDNAGQDEGTLNDWSLQICYLRTADDCTAIVDLNGVIPSDTYHFPDEIESEGIIPDMGVVIFKAPNLISLFPDFLIEDGGSLEAYIEDCNE